VNRHLTLIILMFVGLIGLVACGGAGATLPAPLPTTVVQATLAPIVVQPTAPATVAANGTNPVVVATSVVTPTVLKTGTPPPKSALSCPAAAALAANAQLAARVNGQGVSLDTFNRQAAQAQAAMVANGLDPKSAAGLESLKSLKLQVLDQMINDVVISQQADREGIKVTDDDLNGRLAQMIQDAGTVDKLNDYMSKNQLTLGDLCAQVRASLLGEVMLNRITSALPTNVEQVHVRQILVSTADLAATLRDRARKGEDMAALAKQYSQDETSKANGGDLGWVPKGVLDPRIDAVIFQIAVNQVSDVIKTDFGYHVVQVTEKDKAKALPPELIQDARQKAFLAWLQAVRETMKIERLVQP
jgi:foldase protein PrsA